LDATMAPSQLELRINRQNLLNEMRMHNGKTMTQFVLMKPRSLKRPKSTLQPVGDEKMRRRVEEMRKQQQAAERGPQEKTVEDVILSPKRGGIVELRAPAEAFEDMPKAMSEEPDKDNTSGLAALTEEAEVSKVLESRLLVSIFRGMQHKDGSGLPRDRVRRCLQVMGYQGLDGDLVEERLRKIPGDDPLSLAQFAKVAVAFNNLRDRQFRTSFLQTDYRNTGYISVREFRSVLRDFGFTMTPMGVAELLDEVGVNHSMQLDWGQFHAALVSVHERSGFTASEVAEIEALFDRYDETGSGCLSAEEMAGIMGWLGHPVSISQAQAALTRFDMDGDCMIDKLEFLLAVREWQNEEAQQVRNLFAKYDSDGDGIMTLDDLIGLLMEMGYTVLPHVVEEIIRMVKAHATGLMFEEVLHLLQKLRISEGFSEQERTEYMETFKRFDKTGQGQLRQFELARVLNWLGYPHSKHRQAELWVRVDVDKSGFVEAGEFLKLLRFLREEEVAAARGAVAEVPGAPLEEPDVRRLLNSLGYAPSEAVVREAMHVCLDPFQEEGPTSLQELLSLVHHVRESQAARLRENDGLADHIVSRINTRFSRQFTAGKRIESQELERLMHQLFPTIRHSLEDREHLRSFIAEEGPQLESLADLKAMVLRLVEQRDERDWQREAKVIAATGFSAAQVAQFREVFVTIDSNGNGYLDDDEICYAFDEAFSRKMIKNERFLRAWSREHRSQLVDFAFFLQLVKLSMSDTRPPMAA